jgi:hypothetical protein
VPGTRLDLTLVLPGIALCATGFQASQAPQPHSKSGNAT